MTGNDDLFISVTVQAVLLQMHESHPHAANMGANSVVVVDIMTDYHYWFRVVSCVRL